MSYADQGSLASYDLNADTNDVNNPKFEKKDGKVVNVQRAIGDANQALQIARRLERDDDKRDFERARVLAAFNGNPPYDEREILGSAQSYRFNVSFGFMEGLIGRATVPYLQLAADSNYIANIEGDLPEHKLSMMRDEFAETIKKWGKWNKLLSRLIQDLILNGYNNAIFPSDYDPWPIFIPQKEGFVHEMTLNEVEDCELFVWKKAYLIHELYYKIADPEAAEKAGWNVENTRMAIEKASQADVFQRHRGGGWTAIESAIRGGTLYSSIVGGKQINAFHVFAAELSGKVTHYIVYNGRGGSQNETAPFCQLFKREDRFDSMSDFLVYYDLEAGDGKWHGSRGLGRRSFNTHRSIDKLRCSILDQAFTSGLTMLQPGDQTSQDEFTLAVVGPFAVIPPGITIAPTPLPAISGNTFQADALLAATSEQRIGDIVPSSMSPIQGRKTATEAQISNARSTLVSKSNLQRFLSPLSKMISIIVKRLIKENSPDPYAKAFQQALRDKGFTDDDFKKIRGAQSTGKIDTVLGNDAQTMGVVFAEFRGDPDVDQIELKKRRLESIIGPKEIEGLIIEKEDQTRQIEASREQELEITTMMAGLPVPVSPRDKHMIHLQVAIQWIQQQMQILGQNPNPQLIKVIDLVGNHAGQHLNFLKEDKSAGDAYKQFEKTLKIFAQSMHKIEDNLRAAVQAKLGVSPGNVNQPPTSTPQPQQSIP